MRLDPGRCPIVLVGAWNRTIFMSPPWVFRNVFRGADAIQVEFDFLARRLSYRTENVLFEILAGQVRTTPLDASPEARAGAIDAACCVLDVLKETPVEAVGFNFGYSTEASELDAILASPDRARFEQNHFALREVAAVRKIAYEDEGILSVQLRSAEGGYVDLNFHWNVPDAATAAHRIRSHAEGLGPFGLQVLERIYNLRLEQ